MTNQASKMTDVALLNLVCANSLGAEFAINRPHDVRLIIRQAQQIGAKQPARAVSHVMYMIVRLQPFKTCNKATALLYGYWMAERLGITFSSNGVAGLLKHEVSVDVLTERFTV